MARDKKWYHDARCEIRTDKIYNISSRLFAFIILSNVSINFTDIPLDRFCFRYGGNDRIKERYTLLMFGDVVTKNGHVVPTCLNYMVVNA